MYRYTHTHMLFVIFFTRINVLRLNFLLIKTVLLSKFYPLLVVFVFFLDLLFLFFLLLPTVFALSSLPLLCAHRWPAQGFAHESDCTVKQVTLAAGWLWLWRASRLSSTMLFVGSDGRTGNSRMIQRYRVRIYDNVPWGTFPYNEHSTSSLEALLRNEDEDTQIKRDERKGDQGRFHE